MVEGWKSKKARLTVLVVVSSSWSRKVYRVCCPEIYERPQRRLAVIEKKELYLLVRGYDYQHQRKGNDNLKEKPAIPWHAANLELARQYFLDYLSLSDAQTASLKGSVVLDAGCGAGRYMAIVREYGVQDIVGIDLSMGGLLKANSILREVANNGHFHLVQGDIIRPPFKHEVFDTIFSIGVLHHLKTPEKGFQALKSLLSRGGQFWIWVYGLESMSLSYRISHLVWLRRITNTWSLQEKYHLCRKLSFIFCLLYFYPLRLINKVLPVRFTSLFPFNDWAYQGKDDIIYGFMDRLQPPYVHYLRKEQLQQYVADLKEITILNPKKRGWVVKGRKL